jgi:hypothetical protein
MAGKDNEFENITISSIDPERWRREEEARRKNGLLRRMLFLKMLLDLAEAIDPTRTGRVWQIVPGMIDLLAPRKRVYGFVGRLPEHLRPDPDAGLPEETASRGGIPFEPGEWGRVSGWFGSLPSRWWHSREGVTEWSAFDRGAWLFIGVCAGVLTALGYPPTAIGERIFGPRRREERHMREALGQEMGELVGKADVPWAQDTGWITVRGHAVLEDPFEWGKADGWFGRKCNTVTKPVRRGGAKYRVFDPYGYQLYVQGYAEGVRERATYGKSMGEGFPTYRRIVERNQYRRRGDSRWRGDVRRISRRVLGPIGDRIADHVAGRIADRVVRKLQEHVDEGNDST